MGSRKKNKEQRIFPNNKEYELDLTQDQKSLLHEAWIKSQPPSSQLGVERIMLELKIPITKAEVRKTVDKKKKRRQQKMKFKHMTNKHMWESEDVMEQSIQTTR